MAIFDSLIGKSNKAKADADDSVMIDDELPSVNRRKGKNKVADMLGIATIIGAGVAMLYVIAADGDKKGADKPKKPPQITSNLPPIVLPDFTPPAPAIPTAVPAIKQPIGLEKLANSTASEPPVAKPIEVKPAKTELSWSDRKLLGAMVLTASDSRSPKVAAEAGKPELPKYDDDVPSGKSAPTSNSLALRLKPTVAQGVSASLLPNRNYLITKGTSLDCAMETAIDSSLPGITTCRLTRDIYSDNGHVVLLDRGSQLVGEYQGGITQGEPRVFILWTRAKTPNGVIVSLDSPGSDELGRAGHGGYLDTHFMQRFGAAILLSLVKDVLAIARNNNNTSLNVGGNGTDQLATEVLKNTVNIPPTLYINQGEHIQVMVARDLDFSSVYGLELKE